MNKALVKKTRPKRYFYAKDVNMNYSFDSLNEMAGKQLGAEPEIGDILICDNKKGDKRKVLQVTADGFMIYYGRLKAAVFQALADHNGKLKTPTKELL